MSVEIIAHQDHLVGLRITVIKQVLDLVRPVDRGAVVRDVDRPPPRQGFGEQKHVGRPYPFVFVSYRTGLPGVAGKGVRVS